MKKLYTMLLGAAIPLMGYADAKTVPYQSTFYQDEEWVVHNLNNDDKTWEDNDNSSDFSGSGFSVGKTYRYHSSNQADDWLIGPAIHLEAGKQYKVKFYLRTQGSDAEDVTLYIGTSDQPAELKESTALIELVDHKDTSGSYHTKAFTVPATGDYHFGIYAYSPKFRYNIKITGFMVREDVFTPGAPTNLTVTPGADRALQASLAWSLPVKDLDGEDIPAGYTYDEVRITRDGVLLNTPQLAGDATEFTDTEAYGLTSGKHTYEVVSVVNGAASPAATVVSKYIGPIAPMDIPFSALTSTWTNDEEFETFWSTDKGRDSDEYKSWSFYSTSWGEIVKSLRYYSSTTMDEWLISPALNFAEAGVYRVSYNANFAQEASTLTMYTGSGTTLGGYTDAFAEISGKLVKDSPAYGYISVDAPCQKQLAFHAYASSTGWNYYDVYDIKVEKWHLAPAQIADLAVAVSDDGEQVTLTWTNPSTTNTGSPLAAITKHIVYCDGEMIATVTDNLTPGAAASYTHTDPSPGIHTYYVETYSGDEKADGNPMQVTSAWVGDETQALPYSTYFTDATRPIWTGFDGNADGITFVYPATGANSKPTLAKVSEVTQHDDYLLSPYLDIDKPGYYNARFAVSGGASGYKLEMGHVADKKNVAASFVKAGDDFSMYGNYSSTYFEQMFHFDAPGRYAIALHTVNTSNPATSSDRAIEVSQFLVEYVPVNPAAPEEFTASPAPGNELKAVLKWTNPTESNFEGVTPVIAKAVISRKQGYAIFEEVGVVTEGLEPGEEFTWYDETLTSPGIYKYQVVLEGPEGKDGRAYAQATTSWVGPGYSLPVSVHMDDNDPDLSSTEWSIYNVNGDENYYVGEITWEKLSGSIGITSNNAEDTDDWAIHGFYQFDKGDEYKFTVRNYTSNTTTTEWELWLGDSDHYDGMTVKLADITTPAEQYVKEDHSFILAVTDGADNSAAPEAQTAHNTRL
ncbi:MAG: choice-of-anchor J domain-containing protein, partial [Muribaculaceae bacterium]|nr:choice-of-anchor J domain-containing protein [Muribaculaceae bacterium]